jgi:acyl dehydratase
VTAVTHALRGLRDASRRWRLALVLWLVNLALASVVALPLAIQLYAQLAGAPAGDVLREGFAIGMVVETLRAAPAFFAAIRGTLLAAVALALLVAPFVAAGTVEVLRSGDSRSLAHRFGRGAGHFGGRFLRAGLLAAPTAAIAAALLGGPWFFVRHRLDDSASDETRFLLGIAGAACAALGILLALLALDYARLEIARRDSRKPMRLYFRALGFVLRHPLATVGLWLVNSVALLLVLALYLALREAMPATSWIAIASMAVAQQAVSLARAGLRVALWSGESTLLDALAPLRVASAPAGPAAPEPETPDANERAAQNGEHAMKLEVGQTASRSATFTAEHVELYAQISGDRNPLHFDSAWVARTRFGRLLVQGGLTTGLLHALVAMDLPGPGTVFLSQNWKFTAPVFIGDTVTAEARVVSLHPTKPVVQLAVKAVRQDGESVLEGEAWCYTARPA